MQPEPSAEPIKEQEQISAHESAMDKIADSFLAEVLAKDDPASAELAGQTVKAQQKSYKHPMAVDIMLAFGLLFAMAGLTVSFVKSYTTHSAKTNIMQGNYKAAIGILRSSPIPEFFGGTSADNSEDLLNQALYLDANSLAPTRNNTRLCPSCNHTIDEAFSFCLHCGKALQ